MSRSTRTAAAVALAALLSACSGGGERAVAVRSQAPAAPAGPAAAVALPSAPPSTAAAPLPSAPLPSAPLPSAPASTPAAPLPTTVPGPLLLAGSRVSGPVLPVSAGVLADADVPGAQQAVNVDVAFGGVLLGSTAEGDRVVGYPSLQLQAAVDGTVVAHVKLARFRCSPQGPLSRATCRNRVVDYADADARSTDLEIAEDGVLTVQVTASGYRYGAGVDRTAGVRPEPTGERLALRAVVTPGAVLSRTGRRVMWRPLAEVSAVSAARPGAPVVPSGRAAQDDGYPNTYRAVLRAR